MSAPASAPLINPFPGLRPFHEDEQHLFFGRESQVDNMVDKLARNRFLAVVGTSGSGKSSLVNCGLKPALRRGLLARAGTSWRIVQFRPGGDPTRALARALAAPGVLFGDLGNESATLEDMVDATLRMSSIGVVDLYEQGQAEARPNLLIVVDQFEELFRYRARQSVVPDEGVDENSIAFVNLLLQAIASDYPIYVVLTMRSDFLGDCARFPGLPEAINKGEYLVPRMTRDERRSAIAGPVAVAGGEISPVLLTRLVNDVGDNPDQLSILQHALNRTWSRWQYEGHGQGALSLSHYEEIGTMEHALDRHAEKAFAELDARRQRICEKVFQALTDKGTDVRGIRRPTKLSTLCAIADTSPDEVVAVIEVFRKPSRSFLMPSVPEKLEPDTVIDISHESLMRVWKRLKGWAEDEAASAAQYSRLVENATLHAKGAVGLLVDPELSLVLEWQEKWRPNAAWAERYDPSFAPAMQFLDRSEEERGRLVAERKRERRRKFRNIQLVAGILGVLALAALALAYTARQEKLRAETNLKLAQKAVDESLSSAGRKQAREAGDLPELEEFRKELLDKAASFYAEFTKQNPKNEALRSEAAAAHSKLGDINRLLGKHEDAVQEYSQAISRFQTLAKEYPGKAEYLRGLGYAHNWLGETLRLWREQSSGTSPYSSSDAERQYDEALRFQQQVHDHAPADSIPQQELARTYYNRGIIRFDSNNIQGAESDFRTAVGLLEPLTRKTASAKTTPELSQDLARAYSNLAGILNHTNQFAEARKLDQLAIDLAEALSRSQPDNREFKLELAKYYNNQARVLVAINELDLAKERNHQALDIIEALINPAPALSIELLKDLQLRTQILEAQGSADARPESDRLFEILKKVGSQKSAREHPLFHVIYMNLGINYIELAKRDLNSGDVKDAEASLERLAQILPELLPEDRETLATYYRALQEEVQNTSAKRRRIN